MIILVTGGSGSGKSEYAENICLRLKSRFSPEQMIYIATMEPFGEEGQKRIARHHALRAGKGFRTIERYTNLLDMPETENLSGIILLECLSNLVANEMFSPGGCGTDNCIESITAGLMKLSKKADHLVVVTNQIFSDGIEYDPGTMEYMEKLGRLNAKLADMSQVTVEVVAGIPMKLKGHLDL